MTRSFSCSRTGTTANQGSSRSARQRASASYSWSASSVLKTCCGSLPPEGQRKPNESAMKKTSSRKKRVSEPSAASLREIPEIDFTKAQVLGRGAVGLRRARALLRAQRGRPKKGVHPGGSSPRSIRFSDAMWRDLERCAKRRRITLHALLREVIAEWLTKAA